MLLTYVSYKAINPEICNCIHGVLYFSETNARVSS